MRENKSQTLRSYLVNSAVLVVIATVVMIVISSFFRLPRLNIFLYRYIEINRFVQRLIALVLLVVTWNLFLRKRLAWLLSVAFLSLSLFMNFVLHHHVLTVVIILCEIYALAVLIFAQNDFKRPTDRLSLQRAGLVAILILAVVFVNALISRASLSKHLEEKTSFGGSLENTVDILFGGRGSLPGHPHYQFFLFAFVWLCAAACLILVLRSALVGRGMSKEDKARARELVTKYGQNPTSYLVLEEDKTLFFGTEVEGVIAYGVVGGVVVVLGDPVCAKEDFAELLSEFKAFCLSSSYQCVFLGATDEFLELYALLGYCRIKCGEEARFKLSEYQLAGGKMAKLRAEINHANKAGLTSYEYKPNEQKDPELEKAIHHVSSSWLEGKKSGELGFSVGGDGLEDPMDRRYFYAKDENGEVVAFNVFTPFAYMNGYMADVTRRMPKAPRGVTEKLIYDGFMAFRDEGIEWGSMGLAPLANVSEEGIKDDTAVKLLELIYEKGNQFYGFKDLHHAKEKYSPTVWAPGYFVYSTKSLTPQIAFAVIKIQNPGGIKDYIESFFASRKKGKT